MSARGCLAISPAVSPADVQVARQLMREYQSLLGIDLCFQGFEDELRALPGDYAPPRGCLLLAWLDGKAIGCVALRALDETRGEMKRLFVRPQARGTGAGRALAERLLAEARAIGYGQIVLDTLPQMAEAQGLYETLGFRDIAPYCVNPIPGARYLGLALRTPSDASSAE